MGDDSSRTDKSLVDTLKLEWSLFWESLAIDSDDQDPENQSKKIEDPFVTGKLNILTLDQVRAMTKALSQDRKHLNQRLETLNKEIELNTAKLESLRLVGAEDHETVKRINELNDLGQTLSEELNKVSERLNLARIKEVEISQRDKSIY